MENPTTRLCENCGQRPATVRLVFAAEGGRRAGALCEACATQLFAAAGHAPGFGAQRREQRPASKTPALDEFGRDLTAQAADGRIDPVIGRAGAGSRPRSSRSRRGWASSARARRPRASARPRSRG